MVIFYDDLLVDIMAKANAGEPLTEKEKMKFIKLHRWIQNDPDVVGGE